MLTFELLKELVKFDGETHLFRGVCGSLSHIDVCMQDGMMILDEDIQDLVKVKTVDDLRRLIGKFENMPVFLADGGVLIKIFEVVSQSSICVIGD
jgi:hypothetical protein